MGGNSGGGGKPGRGGGGGEQGTPSEQLMNNLRSGKLSLEESVAAERAMYRAQSDAFFKEKNYEKSAELDKKYKVMRDVNAKFKIEQDAARAGPLRITGTRQGSSVRNDDNAGGRRDLTSDFAKRMAKERGR